MPWALLPWWARPSVWPWLCVLAGRAPAPRDKSRTNNHLFGLGVTVELYLPCYHPGQRQHREPPSQGRPGNEPCCEGSPALARHRGVRPSHQDTARALTASPQDIRTGLTRMSHTVCRDHVPLGEEPGALALAASRASVHLPPSPLLPLGGLCLLSLCTSCLQQRTCTPGPADAGTCVLLPYTRLHGSSCPIPGRCQRPTAARAQSI